MIYDECPQCGGNVTKPHEYAHLNYSARVWVVEKFCSGSCREKWLDQHPYIYPRLGQHVGRRE